jgi:hypothetical protein
MLKILPCPNRKKRRQTADGEYWQQDNPIAPILPNICRNNNLAICYGLLRNFREDIGKRTPHQLVIVKKLMFTFFTEKGIFIYEPQEHYLKLIRSGDYRKMLLNKTLLQKPRSSLIYVANYDKMTAYAR